MLTLLLLGQTILGPVGTVWADESGESVVEGEQEGGTDPKEGPTVTDPSAADDSGDGDHSNGNGESKGESNTPVSEPENDAPSDEQDYGDGDSSNEEQPAENDKGDIGELAEENFTMELMEASEYGRQDIDVSSVVVSYTINGTPVTGAPITDLPQDATVKGTFEFVANIEVQDDTAETAAWAKGSSFTFKLPPTLINYDDNFKSNGIVTGENGIKFTYATSGNVVTVTLAEDAENPTSTQKFTITFLSGFTLVGNDVEQELVIPDGLDGDVKTISLTFTPKLTGNSVTKEQVGNVEITNGERLIMWEAWVNKAGKQLTNATVTDVPTATGSSGVGHDIVSGSVNVEQYKVKLDGSAELVNSSYLTKDDFPLDLEDGKHAYKITYKTKVTGANLAGTQQLSNTITLTNKGQNDGSATKGASTTYGIALKKNRDTSKTNNNYTSNWEIIYNYNLAPIPVESAVITDTLTGSHKIKEDSISVYPVTVDNSGEYQSKGPALTAGTHYTIDFKEQDNKFEISFHSDNDDGDKVIKAYKVEYEANYTDQHFFDSANSETITNVVVSNEHPDVSEVDRTATHTLEEDILTKGYQVDFDNKEIIWTITVNNKDSSTGITGLKITDTFTEGKHTLVGGIDGFTGVKNGVDGVEIALNNAPDLDKGFTITGITVPAGQSKTITYRTAYEILPNGSVHAAGYKNTAEATWTTDKTYTITKSAHYKPKPASAKNGSKSGTFNYHTQQFTWNIKINVNKQDIAGAKLEDTLGDGHKIVQDSFRVCEDKLGTGGDTTDATIRPCADADLITSGYTIATEGDTKFTLTFDNPLDSAINNKAYLVTYNTIDDDNILGIESKNPTKLESKYSNSATFNTTAGGGKTYEFDSEPVIVKNANELLSKKVSAGNTSNNTTGTLTWQAEVNKSHSNLGNVVFSDQPSVNLMILPETVQYRKMIINETTGDITYGSTTANPWINALSAGTLILDPNENGDGSFSIDLGELNNKGYLVQYETYVLGDFNESFSNEAKINFGFATADNQKDEIKVNSKFAFSKSDATASATKGKVNLKKVGYNPASGETTPLKGVTFKLMKKVGNNDRLIAEKESDADGNLTFENVYYGTYFIEEVAAPAGYKLAKTGRTPFVMNEKTDTTLTANADKVVEIVNNKIMQPGEMCNVFTLTVKDEDGKARENVKIKFVQNDNDIFVSTTNTDSNGRIIIDQPDLPAGPYNVLEIDANGDTIKDLGSVQVKYTSPDCSGEVQPAPSCPLFTITVKDGTDNIRPNIKVTVKKQNTTNEVATGTTNGSGQITVPYKDLPAGTYDVYENELFLGEIDVSYIGTDKCQAEVDITVTNAGTCPVFTLTVTDRSNNPREGVEVTVKDASGKEVEGVDANGDPTTRFTTDANGEITFPYVIEPGTYNVYEGTKLIDSFIVKDTCKGSVKPRPVPPTPAPSCDAFTITVKQDDVVASADVALVLKSGETEVATGKTNADGTIKFAKGDLPQGTYTAFDEGGNDLGTVTVSYEQDECQAVINLLPKTCDAFTLTVKQSGEFVEENTEITLKDQDGNTVVTGKTDATGTIQFAKADLPAGTYTAYDKDDQAVGTVTVSYEEGKCQADIDLLPKTCDAFTLTVKQTGELVEENTEVTLKDADGNTIATGTTDADGKIIFAKSDLPAGMYTVYDTNDKAVGSVMVSYEDGKCQAVIDVMPNVCETFTLTVNERPYANVVVKDLAGNVIVTGATDVNGHVTFSTLLPQGSYVVTVNENGVGYFTVKDDCSATVTLESEPGGGGGTPPTPGNPGSETPGGGTPGTPGTETPGGGTPTPETPGNETPKPGTPGTDKPGSETPTPETPGPEKPGTEKPKPETPGTETPQPEVPGTDIPESENPNTETSVPGTPDGSEITDNPTMPDSPANSSTNMDQVVSKGKKKPATPTNGKVLPQTGEAYPILPLTIGFTLISLGLWMLRRKHVSVKQ